MPVSIQHMMGTASRASLTEAATAAVGPCGGGGSACLLLEPMTPLAMAHLRARQGRAAGG